MYFKIVTALRINNAITGNTSILIPKFRDFLDLTKFSFVNYMLVYFFWTTVFSLILMCLLIICIFINYELFQFYFSKFD